MSEGKGEGLRFEEKYYGGRHNRRKTSLSSGESDANNPPDRKLGAVTIGRGVDFRRLGRKSFKT